MAMYIQFVCFSDQTEVYAMLASSKRIFFFFSCVPGLLKLFYKIVCVRVCMYVDYVCLYTHVRKILDNKEVKTT